MKLPKLAPLDLRNASIKVKGLIFVYFWWVPYWSLGQRETDSRFMQYKYAALTWPICILGKSENIIPSIAMLDCFNYDLYPYSRIDKTLLR